jgi:hypothetical protein
MHEIESLLGEDCRGRGFDFICSNLKDLVCRRSVLGSLQSPNFFLKSDMFMRVRVRVNSTEILAGGLVLPLSCNADVIFTGIANAVWVHAKLDLFKRSPKAHLVEKVECLDGSKRYLFYCKMSVLPWDIEKLQL